MRVLPLIALSFGIAAVTVPHIGDAQSQQNKSQQVQQADGWVLTGTLKVQMVNMPTDTNGPTAPTGSAAVRAIRMGASQRIEFNPIPNASPWNVAQMVPVGLVLLTAVSDTGATVTVIDSARKTYNTPNIHEMGPFGMGGPGQTAQNMPVVHVSDIAVTVDSIGPGPVILGHPTVHYRQTQHAKIQTDMTKWMTLIVRTEAVTDLDIATGISNAPRLDGMGLERISSIPAGLILTGDLAPAIRTAAAKYPRGVILHLEGYEIYGPATRKVTLDIDKWGQERVDTSLLAVPSGYMKGSAMMLP